jgi:hypothetical protein
MAVCRSMSALPLKADIAERHRHVRFVLKSHCVALAKTGGESSYTELITCMEMARDVRKLHEADNSSAPVSVGLPAPANHRQPTAR